ncbi:hypothetical protein C8J57DRAFT_1222906 [Mycena rebaudengoi]|nr:hypothetical protein C8J57DRAFT_1222906 [Mycena rebaudengoi]
MTLATARVTSLSYCPQHPRATPAHRARYSAFVRQFEKKKCLVADYSQLAAHDPQFRRRMVERAAERVDLVLRMHTYRRPGGGDRRSRRALMSAYAGVGYREWTGTLKQLNDTTPFTHVPRHTSDFPDHQNSSFCSHEKSVHAFALFSEYLPPIVYIDSSSVPNRPPFSRWASFRIMSQSRRFPRPSRFYSSASQATFTSQIVLAFSNVPQVPMQTKSTTYYEHSWWSGKYAYADNVQWEDKVAKICELAEGIPGTFTRLEIQWP